jgi:hypothetical protein
MNAFFEELDGLFERQVTLLELVDDAFELLERVFELGHGCWL